MPGLRRRGRNDMKIKCTQCGAEHSVTERDFFLRCTYCDSRLIVNPPASTPALVIPSVTEEDVRRLFPPNSIESVTLKYFPYFDPEGHSADHDLKPCFNQPWQELETYSPPDGDRRIFDQDMGEPDEFIPFDRDMLDDQPGTVVFHPFYILMLRLEGYNEGLLVDGVTGRPVGELPIQSDEMERDGQLRRLFMKTLLIGLCASVPAFFLFRAIGLSWLNSAWLQIIFVVLIAAGSYYLKR